MAAEGFKVADAYVELTLDKDKLRRELDEELGDISRRSGPEADRGGRGLGDKLSQGMRMSLIRNSPLIVAAVTGALMAGAPLVLAASTALFAGVGIVAAAQSQEVRQSWLGTWGAIRDGAIDDADAIVPVLVNLADRVQNRFQAMRPILRDIFVDAGPQIDVFADGVMGLADNVLPGFQRAIERGMPVTRGFAEFLERTGTGLTGFLDGMSEHSISAGAAFGLLGGTMEQLLPLLGQLLGQGAELATGVLPLLNGSLSALNTVMETAGPLLPVLAQGWMAWKVAQTASGWIDNLSASVQRMAVRGTVGATTASTMSRALDGMGRTIPIAGAALVLFATQMAKNEEDAKRWGQALLDGGKAARMASEEMRASVLGMSGSWVDALEGPIGSIDKMVSKVPLLGKLWGSYAETSADAQGRAKEAADRLWESMDAGERAQQRVRTAQSELNDAIDKYGASSGPATYYAAKLGEAQAAAAKLAGEQEAAIRGVTEAMIAMVDQGRSMVDATFAQEDALRKVNEAALEYLAAVRDHGKSSAEAADKLGELNRAYSDAGKSSRELAESNLPAAVDDQTRAYFGARAELAYYHDLLAKGVDLPPSMDEYVAILERQAGGAAATAAAQDVLKAAIEELGIAVTEVPGEKAVTITGQGTDELRQKLSDLDFQIERIPGTTDYKIIADDAQSELALTTLMGQLAALDIATAKPNVDVEGAGPALNDLDSITLKLLGIDGFTASPNIDAQSDVQTQTDADLEDLFGLGGTTVTPQTQNQTNVPETTANDLGLLFGLGGTTVTPQSNLNDQGLRTTVDADLGALAWLNGQNPTPTGWLNDGPFMGTVRSLRGWLDTVNTWSSTSNVDAVAHTANAENALNTVARARTAIVDVVTRGMPNWSTGGRIGDTVEKFAVGGQPGGKVIGPGSTTSDSVGPYRTEAGEGWLSNFEWIVKAASAMKYGDTRMAAVNAGVARILLPGEELQEPIRRGIGGPMARFGDRLDGLRDRLDSELAGLRQTVIRVENVVVKIETPMNLMSQGDLRKAGLMLRDVIIGLDREQS